MSTERLLKVIDDFAPAALFGEAGNLSSTKGWYFGHDSSDEELTHFWKMDLEGIEPFDSIWTAAKDQCERLVGMPLRVVRQYANGHTYGLGGQPRIDDERPGCYTLLYCPMEEWKENWEGETVFYDEHGEIVLSVKPRPNRAIFFDSRIPHVGRAPARACQDLRISVAYKLETFTTPVAVQGPVRQYTVSISAGELKERVAEHLTKLGLTVRLPGFRPGKIPVKILEDRYGAATRSEVVKRLASEAAAKSPQGSLVTSIDVVEKAGGLELHVTADQLPDLPDPDFSKITLRRFTASDSDLEAAGIGRDALIVNLKQQVLDHLEESYPFPLPGELVEREFHAILQAARAGGESVEGSMIEFRPIAERRVRLGIVISELARRQQLTGPRMEDRVVEWLISIARIEEQVATLEELQELA